MPIEHVTDTALWVASHRAAEGERPDALFHDPLAGTLAGERGRAIAESMPNAHMMQWVMAIRTVAIDRLILEAIRLGADTVLNIGAGLDTRPYRLDLPPALRWIEVDLPMMIEYKTARLGNAQPRCLVEHVALDLSEREARNSLLARVGRESHCVLVITEGVIPYLPVSAVEQLADDLHAVPQLRYWVQDYYHGNLRRHMRRSWQKRMRAAPIQFHVDDWFAFFAVHGWRAKESVATVDEARRVGRKFPFKFPESLVMVFRFAFMSRARRSREQQATGYVLMERG